MAKKKIKTEEEKTSRIVSFTPDVRVEVSFSRTIQVNDEWAKAGVKITRNIEDLESSEEEFEKLWEKAESQVCGFLEKESDEEEEEKEEPDEDEDEDDSDEDEDDSDEDEDDSDEDEDDSDEDEDDSDEDEDEDDSDEDDSDEDEDEDDSDEDEDEISEDEINAMSKKELKELCKNTEGLEDIDTSAKIKPLRKAVIEALFEDSDWENTDWDE